MYYFASDMHFGLDHGGRTSHERERLLVRWLDEVSADAGAIFLVGDVFDFWFEYRRVVPKGCVRFLGKIAELTDRGVEVHFFAGNHDRWLLSYLGDECGMQVHRRDATLSLGGKRVYITHGDNLDIPLPPFKRLLNWCLRSQAMYRLLACVVHPDLTLRVGRWWSGQSRLSRGAAHVFADETEPTVKFARARLLTEPADYFVFGHLHYKGIYPLGPAAAIYLGDWLDSATYAVMDTNGNIELKEYAAIP